MVAAAGAGSNPIPYKALTSDRLVEAIHFCLSPQAAAAAAKIAVKMSAESGVREAVKSFHSNLPLERLPCDLLPDQPAAWTYRTKKKTLKLSKTAVGVLEESAKVNPKKLEL